MLAERRLRTVVYSRPGCHLCEVAWELLEQHAPRLGLDLAKLDISSDPELERLYGSEIPVVFLDGHKLFKYRVDPRRLEAACRARRRA